MLKVCDQLIRVLGIETSCDETAASIVSLAGDSSPVIRSNPVILSNVVLSQIEEHAAFGGVVPEIAARAHVEALDGIVEAALADSGLELSDVDAIAATAGPGLVGGLIVGLMTAKAIAAATGKPLLAINHLEGHALTARLTEGLEFPYLLLLVSGGHTQIVRVAGVGDYQRWATTIDDALGEAFDKTAKMLGLPYPGGPNVEKAARNGDAARFAFPRPMKGATQPDFSFSGLKTAVRQAASAIAPLTEQDISDICASFQAAVSDAVADRVARALGRFREEFPVIATPALVVAGGVAANKAIKETLEGLCRQNGFRFVAPPLKLCTDNAAMIAWAGIERLNAGLADDNAFDFIPRSRWPLDSVSAPVVGSGRRGAKA
jgi:N6-L-threonylcarbamoyladenine synthase